MNPAPASPATVFVVDDDDHVRRSLARLLRSAGHAVEPLASAREFLAHPRREGPGCVLLDLQMPAPNGLDLQAELAKRGTSIPIIFVTGHGDIDSAVQAIKSGAVDFLTKPYRAKELLSAVANALEKDRVQRAALAEQQSIRQRFSTLTSREREVLNLVVAGYLNKEIAAELGNSERTVKVQRGRVMSKMNAGSVAELTRMMERSGRQAGPPEAP